jgi:hypothetical protein
MSRQVVPSGRREGELISCTEREATTEPYSNQHVLPLQHMANCTQGAGGGNTNNFSIIPVLTELTPLRGLLTS